MCSLTWSKAICEKLSLLGHSEQVLINVCLPFTWFTDYVGYAIKPKSKDFSIRWIQNLLIFAFLVFCFWPWASFLSSLSLSFQTLRITLRSKFDTACQRFHICAWATLYSFRVQKVTTKEGHYLHCALGVTVHTERSFVSPGAGSRILLPGDFSALSSHSFWAMHLHFFLVLPC